MKRHTVGREIQGEALKRLKKAKYILQVLEHGEKTENHGKTETHSVGSEIWQETLKNMKMRNAYLQDLEYGDKLKILENDINTLQDLKYDETQ